VGVVIVRLAMAFPAHRGNRKSPIATLNLVGAKTIFGEF
jgi:hypothetical protein